MEIRIKKMTLAIVAIVLLVAGAQVTQLQARSEVRSSGVGSRSTRAGRSSSQGRTQHADRSRTNRRNDDRRHDGRHDGDRHDGRWNRDGYYDNSGAWIVPAAVGLGVGAAVLSSEDCPLGTYFDPNLNECIVE